MGPGEPVVFTGLASGGQPADWLATGGVGDAGLGRLACHSPGVTQPEFRRLTDAGNVMEAGALREFLEAHGIQCFVKGEQHASMLGSFGAAIGFEVMVPTARFDEATALLAAFREAGPVDDLEAQALAAAHPDGGVWPEDAGEGDTAETAMLRSPTTAMTLAVIPSLGCAHFYTGAFQRGLLLAGVQLFAVAMALKGNLAFFGLAAAAIAADMLGGVSRVKTLNAEVQTAGAVRGGLPQARLLDKPKSPQPPG